MVLSQNEYEAIINDDSKTIREDIIWEARSSSPAREFRIDIDSSDDIPIFVKGWYNPFSGKLSYAIVHRSVGRIYGLDLGADHRNPDGERVGEKHKNYWVPGTGDKWAYVPEDINQPWNRPVAVWEEFYKEARLTHSGTLRNPVSQGVLAL